MQRRRFRLLALAACLASAGTAWGAGPRLPDGPGADLVYARCQTCHDLQYVVDAKGLMASQWSAVLASMHDYGLVISDEEKSKILQYLSTYLGPHPPPAAPAGTSAPAPAGPADGRAVFARNCAACHGEQGQGQGGSYPPLAGNPDLAGDPALAVLVVLNGLAGPIEVAGRRYDGSMPAFGHLRDDEIAAVVSFVRSAWGGAGGAPVSAADVAARRDRPLSPADVHALRAQRR